MALLTLGCLDQRAAELKRAIEREDRARKGLFNYKPSISLYKITET